MAFGMAQRISAPDRVQAALSAAGVDVRIEEFPSSTRTAQEAAAAVGTSVGQIVKSLVFLAGDAPVLALVSGENRLDPARLAALTGAPIGKADADAVRQATGYTIGGVPPTGFPAPIPTFIDRHLMQYDVVWAAAGTPRHVFPIAPAELVRITGGRVADLRLVSMKITVAPEPFDSADARRLVAALDAHLAGRYSPDQMFGPNLHPEHLKPGLGTFVIARVDGLAIGCGALRRLDETTSEVKRMYVEPELRGRGVAREILEHLEAAARTLGTHRLVLETGIYQAEAISLYRRAGFSPTGCFGEYVDSPTSVCFEKMIEPVSGAG